MVNLKKLLKKNFVAVALIGLFIAISAVVSFFLIGNSDQELGLNNARKFECSFASIAGDGVCDDKSNNLQCNFDGGDCCSNSSTFDSCLLCFCYEEEQFKLSTEVTTEKAEDFIFGQQKLFVGLEDKTFVLFSTKTMEPIIEHFLPTSVHTVDGWSFGCYYGDSLILVQYSTFTQIYKLDIWAISPKFHEITSSFSSYSNYLGGAALVGQNLILTGGATDATEDNCHGTIRIWNFISNTWRVGADLPTDAGWIKQCVVEFNSSHAIIAGGRTCSGNEFSDSIYLYGVNADDNHFTKLASLSTRLFDYACGVLFDEQGLRKTMIITGGKVVFPNGYEGPSRKTYQFNLLSPMTSKWVEVVDHPLPRFARGGTMTSVGSKLIYLPHVVPFYPDHVPSHYLVYDTENGWQELIQNKPRVKPSSQKPVLIAF